MQVNNWLVCNYIVIMITPVPIIQTYNYLYSKSSTDKINLLWHLQIIRKKEGPQKQCN